MKNKLGMLLFLFCCVFSLSAEVNATFRQESGEAGLYRLSFDSESLDAWILWKDDGLTRLAGRLGPLWWGPAQTSGLVRRMDDPLRYGVASTVYEETGGLRADRSLYPPKRQAIWLGGEAGCLALVQEDWEWPMAVASIAAPQTWPLQGGMALRAGLPPAESAGESWYLEQAPYPGGLNALAAANLCLSLRWLQAEAAAFACAGTGVAPGWAALARLVAGDKPLLLRLQAGTRSGYRAADGSLLEDGYRLDAEVRCLLKGRDLDWELCAGWTAAANVFLPADARERALGQLAGEWPSPEPDWRLSLKGEGRELRLTLNSSGSAEGVDAGLGASVEVACLSLRGDGSASLDWDARLSAADFGGAVELVAGSRGKNQRELRVALGGKADWERDREEPWQARAEIELVLAWADGELRLQAGTTLLPWLPAVWGSWPEEGSRIVLYWTQRQE